MKDYKCIFIKSIDAIQVGILFRIWKRHQNYLTYHPMVPTLFQHSEPRRDSERKTAKVGYNAKGRQ